MPGLWHPPGGGPGSGPGPGPGGGGRRPPGQVYLFGNPAGENRHRSHRGRQRRNGADAPAPGDRTGRAGGYRPSSGPDHPAHALDYRPGGGGVFAPVEPAPCGGQHQCPGPLPAQPAPAAGAAGTVPGEPQISPGVQPDGHDPAPGRGPAGPAGPAGRGTAHRFRRGLDCAGVMALDPALRRRVLGSFLRQAGTAEPEAVHIAQAEALAGSNSPSAWGEFPGGVVLMRQYRKLVNYHPGPPLAETALPVPGEVRAGGWLARCKISPPGEKRENSPFTFALACDTIRQTPLVLRPRRPGDRLCLPGGTKTVKKLFIDRKIPAAWRDTLPVLAAGDRVLAVAGIGGDVRFLPQPGAPAVTVSLEKIK